MSFWRSAWGREERDGIETRTGNVNLAGAGLEAEYEAVIRAQLERLGVAADAVEVEVRAGGALHDGRSIYLGVVRLVRWQPRGTLRLLVSLPLLEARTRRSLQATWLTELSHFGGLWVHASSSLRSPAVLSEMREVLEQLERVPLADQDTVPAGLA